ncbi:MAG TPA: hypothetical protein VJL59_20500 [Anaerolineales bacterium]|nr:hypothetical protein [Anaerolineales bacterium]
MSADTDKIKDFVFESAKLPEIRGASMMLDELNWGNEKSRADGEPGSIAAIWEKYNLPEKARIYAGGGSLLALIPLNLAEDLHNEMEALYPRVTGTATITCVFQPFRAAEVIGTETTRRADLSTLAALQQALSPTEWQRVADYYGVKGGAGVSEDDLPTRGGFRRAMELQITQLRRAKLSKATAPLYEAMPYVRRCDSCGSRPSAVFDDKKKRYLCAVCDQKFAQRGYRRSLWVDRCEEYWAGKGRAVEIGEVQDLTGIGAAAKGRKDYVGFIYADGNGVGEMVEQSATLKDYQKKSGALRRAVQEVVYDALYDALRESSASTVRPFEIITIGGDDALLIVPADAALPVAYAICAKFGPALLRNDWPGQPPTVSAGVVIAHADNPVYFLRDLAEQLLKSAKRRTYEVEKEKGQPEGAVDFLILKSQSTVATDLKHVRSSPILLLRDERDEERVYLTKRPYTCQELERLIGHTEEIARSRVAKTQMRSFARVIQRGRLPAAIYFLYQWVRLKEEGQQLARIHKEWAGTDKTEAPWLKRQPRKGHTTTEYETPWLDLIELLDFTPA